MTSRSAPFPERHRYSRIPFFLGLGFASVLAIVVLAAWVVFRSGLFHVQSITVEGTRLLKHEQFVAQFRTQLIGSSAFQAFLGPQNILFWVAGSDDVSSFSPVLFPQARSFHVETSLFSRTVLIRVEERPFAGIWCSVRESCYAFDDGGILFAPVPSAAGSLFLTITDRNEDRIGILGLPFLTNPEWIGNVLTILRVVRDEGIGIAGVSILDREIREWELRTDSRVTFRFDLAFIPDHFPAVLRELKSRFSGNSLLLDFRVPRRVYYK